MNLYSQRDGATDFKLLSRDTHSPYVDNRPMLVAGKPELRAVNDLAHAVSRMQIPF